MTIAVPVKPKLTPTSSYDLVDAPINDPQLKKIAQDLFDEFKAATFRVGLGMSLPSAADSWENLVRSRFEQVSPDVRGRASAKLRSIYDNVPLRGQVLGRFAAMDLSHPQVLVKVRAPLEARPLVTRLASDFKREGKLAFHPMVSLQAPQMPTVLKPQDYLYKFARLKLDKVYCMDETGTDFIGSDEIDLGGIAVDETGDTSKISAFRVSSDFDTGETKDFSPDKTLVQFGVVEGGENWPKVYRVTLTMAERDWGDFPSWIGKLYEKVKGRLKEYLSVAIAGVGGAIGGILGTLVGAVAGWVVGWIVDNVIGWVQSLWEDDIIATHTFTLTHAGPRASFNGAARSGALALVWSGGTGKYRTHTYWELGN